MKTAVILYGEYSDTFKKNDAYKDADLYLLPYSDMPHSGAPEGYNVVRVVPTPTIPDIHKVHEGHKFYYVREQFNVWSRQLLTNKEYDITVTASFQTVITEFPTKPGEYHANPVVRSGSKVPYFEIISDQCVRFGNTPEFFSDLSKEKRKMILDHLYKGRVSDYTYFTPPERTKYAFMIPSCVRVAEKPFNYHTFGRRSSFTAEERFVQTERQVRSVKETLGGDVTSLVLEGSPLRFSEMERLSQYSHVVLFTHDERGNYHANENPNKSVYEIYVLGKVLPMLEFDWAFKFGGRYHLRNDFDIVQYKKEKPVYKIVPSHLTFTKTPIIECVIYSFPFSYKEKYVEMYRAMLEGFEREKDVGVENFLLKYVGDDYEKVDTLGVLGRDGVYTYDKFI